MPGTGGCEIAKSLIGTYCSFVPEVDDMEAACKKVSARGVGFAYKPGKQPRSWWATNKDPDGNSLGLHHESSAGFRGRLCRSNDLVVH